ncbi:2-oxoglutarate and iron-dependent oxygenase domain-containing protein [Micromonospora echinospora]|uniref:2-oxoglutarate and iron-dependent oxygenase domain-containing protein n=1 Tax=Micromonospora echinospora TaxID=1877 RepID=UPI00340294C1
MIPYVELPGPAAQWTAEDRAAVAQAIGKAFRNGGFFLAGNHGVPAALVDGSFAEMTEFYRLPQSEKDRYAVREEAQFLGYRGLGGEKSRTHSGAEACEQYRIGNTTGQLSLAGSPAFYHEHFPTSTELFRHLVDLGDGILSASAVDLGIEDGHFDRYLTEPMHRLGLNFYGATHIDDIHNEEELAMSPHTDLSLITILTQDEPGLEVRTSAGEWIEVSMPRDTFLVFLGDYVQRWTNGVYDATPHRVCRVRRDRRSIQYKHRPDYNTVIAPLDHFVGANQPARYGAIDTGPNYISVLKSILGL